MKETFFCKNLIPMDSLKFKGGYGPLALCEYTAEVFQDLAHDKFVFGLTDDPLKRNKLAIVPAARCTYPELLFQHKTLLIRWTRLVAANCRIRLVAANSWTTDLLGGPG